MVEDGSKKKSDMKLAFSLLAVFALRGATADIACVTDFEPGDNVDRYPDKVRNA